jgi:hypothetical protein
MIVVNRPHASVGLQGKHLRLQLNGIEVGTILVRGGDASWGFGDFTPLPAFADFATVFGRWSLLMHADDPGERLSREAGDALREAENAIDAIHAALCSESMEQSHPLAQVNIDGPLIEWKVF